MVLLCIRGKMMQLVNVVIDQVFYYFPQKEEWSASKECLDSAKEQERDRLR